MRIAEVAERSGFSPATLRFYEDVDLLPAPARTPSGYRAYDESVLDRLAFIARAKSLGCTLEEVAELMPQWEGGRCAPVKARLRQLAVTKLDETRTTTAALTAFAADLEGILAGLRTHTPEGPCDSDCCCVSDPAPPIGCTLEPAALPSRLQQWRDLTDHVTARTPIEGGLRLDLDAGTPLGELAELLAAEQSCCSFFAFALTVDARGAALEVRGPAEALALFG